MSLRRGLNRSRCRPCSLRFPVRSPLLLSPFLYRHRFPRPRLLLYPLPRLLLYPLPLPHLYPLARLHLLLRLLLYPLPRLHPFPLPR